MKFSRKAIEEKRRSAQQKQNKESERSGKKFKTETFNRKLLESFVQKRNQSTLKFEKLLDYKSRHFQVYV